MPIAAAVACASSLLVWACSEAKEPRGTSEGATSLAYTPDGCDYVFEAPESRAFRDLARDEDEAIGDALSATPVRVRLGLGGGTRAGEPGYADPSTMAAFTWETPARTRAAKVRFGTDPSNLAEVRRGHSWTTLPPESGPGSNDPPMHLHEVHVCGLAPSKTYYYQVGGGAPGREVWSAVQSFSTVPRDGKIAVGLSGDSRDDPHIFQLVQLRMRDRGVAMQLFSGDLCQFTQEASAVARILDKAWKDPDDPSRFLTLGQTLFVPVAGNHDAESAQFYGSFALPGDGPLAEAYASFNVGPAHVVTMSDYYFALPSNRERLETDEAKAQMAWLEADLEKANQNRAAQPFLIFLSHRGMYTTSQHAKARDVLQVRRHLAPVFDRFGVDLVLSGHDHTFERTKPLKYGTPDAPVIVEPSGGAGGDARGTIFLVSAGAGAEAYQVETVAAPYRDKRVNFGKGTPFVGVYSFLVFEGRSLAVETYGLREGGRRVQDDELIDRLELTR
jgi:hypothetical protein